MLSQIVPQGAIFAVIFYIHAYKPAGGFSCIDIQYPSASGTVAQDVDLVGHNFRGTTDELRIIRETYPVFAKIMIFLKIDRQNMVECNSFQDNELKSTIILIQ